MLETSNKRPSTCRTSSTRFRLLNEVNDIKKEMADCEIPVNIELESELQAYMERLDRIKADFRDLKQADEDFDGEAGSEKEIKALIR